MKNTMRVAPVVTEGRKQGGEGLRPSPQNPTPITTTEILTTFLLPSVQPSAPPVPPEVSLPAV